MTATPVLDMEELRRLGEQLGDPVALCEFLRRYVGMLDQRIDRLEHALTAQDHAGWMDAVLSLKASSALAGARALAAEATTLEERAQEPPSPGPRGGCRVITCGSDTLELLRALAAETARQLRMVLRRLRDGRARLT